MASPGWPIPAMSRIAVALALVALSGRVVDARAQQTFLIRDATIVDGTGRAGYRGSLRVKDGRIAAVGKLTARPHEPVIEAKGLVLAPGFIDTHSHSYEDFASHPDLLGSVSQGITTVVVGLDGESVFPLARLFAGLERAPVAVNVASYAGHGTIRGWVMGKDYRRVATPGELAHMRALLRQDMRAGALGLSTGLEYDPGIYSDTSEVLNLASEAARVGGRYASHIRSEDRREWLAIEEAIEIGKVTGMPVQISHLKLGMRSLWHQAERLLARLDSARAEGVDVSADVYPYTYWVADLATLFPARDFTNRDDAEFALREVVAPDGLRFLAYDPDSSYVGLTLAEISARTHIDPVTILLTLTSRSDALARQTGEGADVVSGLGMAEDDVERIITWPQANLCSDGAMAIAHPRGYGSFPRLLGHYVRELSALPLEEAVRKMTSLASSHMGFRDRGTIAVGQQADLVLLDPARVRDRATPEKPALPSVGIARVWVNGVPVYANGRTTGKFPGRVIRRANQEARSGK
jgi:N-acyl-D-amino-acid deacylase